MAPFTRAWAEEGEVGWEEAQGREGVARVAEQACWLWLVLLVRLGVMFVGKELKASSSVLGGESCW